MCMADHFDFFWGKSRQGRFLVIRESLSTLAVRSQWHMGGIVTMFFCFGSFEQWAAPPNSCFKANLRSSGKGK